MAQKCGRLPWEGSPALGAGCTSHGSQWCQIPHCAIQCPWCAGSNVSVCLLGTTLFLRMPCPGDLKSPLSLCLGRSSSWHLLGESCFSLKSFFNYVRALCVWRASARGCTGSHVWSSAHRSWELVLSFHHVCTGWFRWSDAGQEPLSTAPSSQSLFLCCSPLKFMSRHFLLQALLILCWAQLLPPQVPRAPPPQAVSLVDLGHSAPRGVVCKDCGIISPFCNGYTR